MKKKRNTFPNISRIVCKTTVKPSGEKEVKYAWEGPIDGEYRMAVEFIDSEFHALPFNLKRIKDFDARTAVFIRVDWRARVVRFFKKTIRNIGAVLFLVGRFFRVTFPEWFAKHCPVLIPTRRPRPPKDNCPCCRKPYTKIIAIDTGDGFEFDWECASYCGRPVIIDNWYPFWFGAWANRTDLLKIGIEEV